MSIFEKTAKYVLGMSVSILIAQGFGLTYPLSAGIMAILSVSDTRKSTVLLAGKRFISTVLALGISALMFEWLGFSIYALCLSVLLYVPLTFLLDVNIGIPPSTVLATHILIERNNSLQMIGEELILFCIGASVALMINVYMPSYKCKIDGYQKAIEGSIQHILTAFANSLQQGVLQGEARLVELKETIARGKEFIYLEQDNQVFRQTNYQLHYLEMRRRQVSILEQMERKLTHYHFESEESKLLAELFYHTAQQVNQKNTAIELLNEVEQLLVLFRGRPLPQTREEFEKRAVLFQLLHDVEHFIQLKVDFYMEYEDEWDRFM